MIKEIRDVNVYVCALYFIIVSHRKIIFGALSASKIKSRPDPGLKLIFVNNMIKEIRDVNVYVSVLFVIIVRFRKIIFGAPSASKIAFNRKGFVKRKILPTMQYSIIFKNDEVMSFAQNDAS